MMRIVPTAMLFFCLTNVALVAAETQTNAEVETGVVKVTIEGDQRNIPKQYQLQPDNFPYKLTKVSSSQLAKYLTYKLTFPSAIKSEFPVNDTVHATYYRPIGKKQFPCVIVLHILGGDQGPGRIIAKSLAQNGVGAVFMHMAYYGPRRPQGKGRIRLISTNLLRTMAGIRQTILDVRRLTAWMDSRKEIDAENLGIVGTSLGGFMTALSAEMEPKLSRVAILLAGGGLAEGLYNHKHPEAAKYRKLYESFGGNKKLLQILLAPVDPLTCAANLKNRKVLMVAAKRDEVVPAAMAEKLWKATGRQKIFWYNTTHYGAVLFLMPALRHLREHFQATPTLSKSPNR
ncbi:MAG: alpha/beta hydrolase family protein [Gemmataceae bacterium]